MRKLLAIVFIWLGAQSMSARQRQLFDKGWLFALADSAGMERVDYTD